MFIVLRHILIRRYIVRTKCGPVYTGILKSFHFTSNNYFYGLHREILTIAVLTSGFTVLQKKNNVPVLQITINKCFIWKYCLFTAFGNKFVQFRLRALSTFGHKLSWDLGKNSQICFSRLNLFKIVLLLECVFIERINFMVHWVYIINMRKVRDCLM